MQYPTELLAHVGCGVIKCERRELGEVEIITVAVADLCISYVTSRLSLDFDEDKI